MYNKDSSYYKVIDAIRRNNIKVYYFGFASAEKCAEQLALEDCELTSNSSKP